MDQTKLLNFAVDELSVTQVLINMGVALALSLLLKFHFERFSMTLSGKKELARLLPFLTMIVCLIISIVKSSLALSLGLVGALSIVRFRTPIKEPEELVYLFMAIAIGLGLGANQTAVTVTLAIVILAAVALMSWRSNAKVSKNLYLNISWGAGDNYRPEAIVEAMKGYINYSDLKRFDAQQESTHISYLIDIKERDNLFGLLDDLKKSFPAAHINFID